MRRRGSPATTPLRQWRIRRAKRAASAASHLALAKRQDRYRYTGKERDDRSTYRFSDESLTLVAVDASGKQTDGWTDRERNKGGETGEEFVREREREREKGRREKGSTHHYVRNPVARF